MMPEERLAEELYNLYYNPTGLGGFSHHSWCRLSFHEREKWRRLARYVLDREKGAA